MPLLGPYPLGIATELPATGVALGHGSSSAAASSAGSSGGSHDRAPMAATTSPRALKLWPLTSASQCGSAATMPPARTENVLAPARGFTHTIRCASRDRRSISRATSIGSPRSQPSERITTTAPRATPRRPWRSLNAFSASPIRVPLDQSGAAAAARSIARSGWREASARVRRVSRVANTNASAPRPLPAAEVRNWR